ncbi:isoprenoid biosynthesis glyoxalase ElbB [Photobacterium damselae]|uniref:isoprenoid biosynthesis glyoxalase ElbB n=1 Tax=Photobacterium damselae TaxID=38293 RepID=UPI004068CC84
MKKIAVLLSGCGVYDGTEINEAVLTLLSLEQYNITYDVFAQNKNQTQVINHLNGDLMDETRNILIESSRIVRGNIKDLETLDANEYSGIIVVGGFGVAKNYSNFALSNNLLIEPIIQSKLSSFIGKPSLYMCISPVIASTIYNNAEITVGNDLDVAKVINMNGCIHRTCDQFNCIVDKKQKLITTPAFMLAQNIYQASKGINKAILALIKLTND